MKPYLVVVKVNCLLVFLLSTFLFQFNIELKAQQKNKVLFLGNSYTHYNNLPKMISDMARSTGDTLIYDDHTPGGYKLQDHVHDATSQSKIAAGGWDYVVIQGQSQESIVRPSDFKNGANALNFSIKKSNPCAVVVPYMTWGRKNGDASNCIDYPIMCTYAGMDTTTRNNYLEISSKMSSKVAPVSVVWSYLRKNHPNIELYTADESHPSLAGSYAAACSFYATLFQKSPTQITFNAGLSNAVATAIKNAAKVEVFDRLGSWAFYKGTDANIRYSKGSGANEIRFRAFNPQNILQRYHWDFGDGNTSTLQSPPHTYATTSTYKVKLTTINCNLQGVNDTASKDTVIELCNHTSTIFAKGSFLCNYDTLWAQPADAYQWYHGSQLLVGETKNYLANYMQYGFAGFTLISTVNGCSELSQNYSVNSPRPQYYFDALGNPCEGDTVKFAVLPFSSAFTGSEIILWYRNGSLLPSMSNKDTLWITKGGAYEVNVVDPKYKCPLDTTKAFAEYKDCDGDTGVVGMEVPRPNELWSLFPNPASDKITIKLKDHRIESQIQIYTATGLLVKEQSVIRTTVVPVSDLPSGIYFVRLKNQPQTTLTFIKQ